MVAKNPNSGKTKVPLFICLNNWYAVIAIKGANTIETAMIIERLFFMLFFHKLKVKSY